MIWGMVKGTHFGQFQRSWTEQTHRNLDKHDVFGNCEKNVRTCDRVYEVSLNYEQLYLILPLDVYLHIHRLNNVCNDKLSPHGHDMRRFCGDPTDLCSERSYSVGVVQFMALAKHLKDSISLVDRQMEEVHHRDAYRRHVALL